MNHAQATTAQVAKMPPIAKMPPALQNIIQRGMEAREKYRDWRSENARPGQAWTLNLPIPLWDSIDEEHRLAPIRPVFFIMSAPFPEDVDDALSEDWWYGFLCLGASATDQFPVLERELERWEHAPYAWWVDIKMPGGGPVSPTADFVMPLYPIHVRREWLSECQADFGNGSEKRVWDQIMSHFESGNAPSTLEEHSRNKVGGHSLTEIVEHIKDCWHVK